MKYEKWSLGYWSLKQYVRFIDWIIHKRVIVLGKELIPKNKPILFAPNHQNALSDPMAILLHTNYQPVWLARADIFKKGIITFILRFLKIMPVYRIRDGKEQLAKNDKTFADSIKVLKNNCALALFPEAAHSGKRQMLAHKKAVPRIVFMAEEKADRNLDIHIVPVGIYYSSYWKFNRTVIVNFGSPIQVNHYLAAYQQQDKTTILALRDAIYNAIEPLTINIKSKKYYHDFERIRKIYGKHFLKRKNVKFSVEKLYKSDRELCNILDQLETTNPEKMHRISIEMKAYSEQLKNNNIRDWLFNQSAANIFHIVVGKITLLLGLPVFLFGFLFNALPFFGIDLYTRKKIKDQAFWSTFFLVGAMLIFPLVYLLQLWAVSPLLPGIAYKITFLASMPLALKPAFLWYILFRKTTGRIRIFFMRTFAAEEYKKLKTLRSKLFKQLDEIIETK